MILNDFKTRVQVLFPVKFDESLIHAEDVTWVDGIINQAIEKALSKFEKIEKTYVTGSIDMPEAVSILKVTRTDEGSSSYGIMDFWGPQAQQTKVKYYFNPSRRLVLQKEGQSVYVEYVVDPTTLDVEDLTPNYIQWAIKYAVALLKEKEGYLGTAANLTELPFEFNYEVMRDEGVTAKETLEEALDEMGSGVLALRTN